jgi:hypothetical protein
MGEIMTHEKPIYAVWACDRGHAHFGFRNREGATVCLVRLTASQAHELAEDLHAVANKAEVVLANVPGIVGGDTKACA